MYHRISNIIAFASEVYKNKRSKGPVSLTWVLLWLQFTRRRFLKSFSSIILC